MTPILVFEDCFKDIHKRKEEVIMGRKKIHPWFWVSLCAGIIFMILGIWRDEVSVLYQKAIFICMECIGLG